MKNLRLGDQFFMPELRKLLKTANDKTEIWIDSGEKFQLNETQKFNDSAAFRKSRMHFYSQIRFNKKIIDKFENLSRLTGNDYWAIHLRGTDRISESESNRRIMKEVRAANSVLQEIGLNVLVTSDDTERGQEMSKLLTTKGFNVVFEEAKNRDRLTSSEAQDSIVDWLGLKNAKAVISFGQTNFSYEAITAGGTFNSRYYLKPTFRKRFSHRLKQEILFFKLYGKLPYMKRLIPR
jgi:hypothetical protein